MTLKTQLESDTYWSKNKWVEELLETGQKFAQVDEVVDHVDVVNELVYELKVFAGHLPIKNVLLAHDLRAEIKLALVDTVLEHVYDEERVHFLLFLRDVALGGRYTVSWLAVVLLFHEAETT